MLFFFVFLFGYIDKLGCCDGGGGDMRRDVTAYDCICCQQTGYNEYIARNITDMIFIT